MTVTLMLLAGGLGGLARYGLEGAVQRRIRSTRPWGTATVNLSGAAALGVLLGLHLSGAAGDVLVRIVGTGFLGGFTTFSTWMVESVRLTDEAGTAGLTAGMINLVGMTVVGVTAAAAGTWLAA